MHLPPLPVAVVPPAPLGAALGALVQQLRPLVPAPPRRQLARRRQLALALPLLHRLLGRPPGPGLALARPPRAPPARVRAKRRHGEPRRLRHGAQRVRRRRHPHEHVVLTQRRHHRVLRGLGAAPVVVALRAGAVHDVTHRKPARPDLRQQGEARVLDGARLVQQIRRGLARPRLLRSLQQPRVPVRAAARPLRAPLPGPLPRGGPLRPRVVRPRRQVRPLLLLLLLRALLRLPLVPLVPVPPVVPAPAPARSLSGRLGRARRYRREQPILADHGAHHRRELAV
eukprot:1092696-Prorocentrum_minimum.AAC.1